MKLTSSATANSSHVRRGGIFHDAPPPGGDAFAAPRWGGRALRGSISAPPVRFASEPSCRQVEDENLGRLAAAKCDVTGTRLERIARTECLPIHFNAAPHDVNVAVASCGDRVLRGFVAVEETGKEPCVLMDSHRSVTSIRRRDQPQPAALV